MDTGPFSPRPVGEPQPAVLLLPRPCPDDVPIGLPFGYDPDYPTADHFHKGQDWKAPKGTPDWFREAGTVVWCHDTGQLGNYIAIQCDRDPNVHRGLAHQSEIYVAEGQHVEAGEVVGLSGGVPGEPGAGLTTGPHIHEEEWAGALFTGERVDPYRV